MRVAEKSYQDPLEVIWIETAKQMGMVIRRDDEVFASWDGESTLTIGAQHTLDRDDSLAQMIFHEICHAMVEGPDSITKPDWGLGNATAVREHACLRLQAHLADRFGLRRFLAATTDFRDYYDRLPETPLSEDVDKGARIARSAWKQIEQSDWLTIIDAALQATMHIAHATKPFADSESLWSKATVGNPASHCLVNSREHEATRASGSIHADNGEIRSACAGVAGGTRKVD